MLLALDQALLEARGLIRRQSAEQVIEEIIFPLRLGCFLRTYATHCLVPNLSFNITYVRGLILVVGA
jgi:hypothetical protein